MMRDSAFLLLNSPEETAENILSLIEDRTSTFVELSKRCGLDPAQDFQYVDLSGVNFDHCDLRGFNFTGSNLSGSSAKNAFVDTTTIFTGADLTGSDIENIDLAGYEKLVPPGYHGLPDSFFRQHWVELVTWMDNLKSTPENYEVDATKLLDVVLRSSDQFVRKTAMRMLGNYVSPEVLVDIIERRFLAANDKYLARASFQYLNTLYLKVPQHVLQMAARQLRGNWAGEAAIFLVQHLPRGRRLNSLVEFMSRNADGVLRRNFIAKLAERDGEATAFVIRNPLNGDIFDFGEVISQDTLEALTRLVVRRRNEEVDYFNHRLPTSKFDNHDIRLTGAIGVAFNALRRDGVKKQVLTRLVEFNALGLKYTLPSSINALFVGNRARSI